MRFAGLPVVPFSGLFRHSHHPGETFHGKFRAPSRHRYRAGPGRLNFFIALADILRGRRRLFYGWYMVAGLATVSLVSVNMAGISLGFFVRPMQDELEISDAYFGWAQSARLIGFGVSSYFIGRILDRYGARWPLVVAGILAGVLVVLLATIQAGWQFVVLFVFIGAIGMQGGGNLYASVPIARWFRRNRGKAMSTVFLGIPAGIFLIPIVTYLITNTGWRATFVATGIFGGIVVVLVAAFVIRRSPEDMGLGPDGDPLDGPADDRADAPRPAAEYSWTRQQALRSSAFWRLVLVYGFLFLAMSTVSLFRTPYFEDQGVSRQMIGFAFSAEAVASVLAAIPAGWALDRYQIRYVASIPLLVMVLAVFATMAASNAWQVFLATCLFGVGAASSSVANNVIWPDYFGSLHIGAIRGRAMLGVYLFSAAGSPFAGFIKDTTGSYFPAWWAAIAGLLVAVVILLTNPRPAAPEADSGTEVEPVDAAASG
jgi:MFS family permease